MPKAPEMLFTRLNSLSPVLVAWMDRKYSMACIRVTTLAHVLRTRRLPATQATDGSRKWRVPRSTMLLSNDVSPSRAMTIVPVANCSPVFREETRPPLCHLGTTSRLRLRREATNSRMARAAS